MDRDLHVLMWTDFGVAQCAVYEDREQAERDAALVDGRVESRSVHTRPAARAGRFEHDPQ
jgi:hypothetical protein